MSKAVPSSKASGADDGDEINAWNTCQMSVSSVMISNNRTACLTYSIYDRLPGTGHGNRYRQSRELVENLLALTQSGKNKLERNGRRIPLPRHVCPQRAKKRRQTPVTRQGPNDTDSVTHGGLPTQIGLCILTKGLDLGKPEWDRNHK